MEMSIRFVIPDGLDLPRQRAMARYLAELAVLHAAGRLRQVQLLEGDANACGPGCTFLDTYVDEQGVTWNVFDCGGEKRVYPA